MSAGMFQIVQGSFLNFTPFFCSLALEKCRSTVYKAFTRGPDLMKFMSNIIMFSPLLNRRLLKYGTWVEPSPVPCIISFIRKGTPVYFLIHGCFSLMKASLSCQNIDHVAHED